MNPRLLPIAVAVVCAHAAALWALQNGLIQPKSKPAESVVMVADWIEQAPRVAAPAPPSPPEAATPAAPKPEPRAPAPPAPKPLPKPAPASAPTAPEPAQARVSETASNNASEPTAGPTPSSATATPAAVPAPSAPPAPPAPPQVELPYRSASYLNNAPPRYPPLSRRMGEQGTVVVRALIEVDGTASQASIKTSSGYERLDQTALQTVQNWRYVPGKRGGVPEAMWFNIPLNFVLD
jgi:periplasmic protein TonB